MPAGLKTKSAKQTGLSSRPKSPRTRAGRDETSRVCAVQRARILTAMTWVVAEEGLGAATVARVVSRARVSRRTFYDLFSGSEDCFLAAFDRSAERAHMVATDATATVSPSSWRGQLRAALAALLGFCDEEPAAASLLVVDALGGGPRVLERRADILAELARAVDGGRLEARRGGSTNSSHLTAEGTVGAVLAVIHARMLEGATRRPLLELLNPLMGMIVLPYLGPAAAARERERPLPRPVATASPRPLPGSAAAAARVSRRGVPPAHAPLEGLNMRLTHRTLMVLAAIAAEPEASNRRIADTAGIHDQGQISKLLARLERLGLVRNAGNGQAHGEPNAWTLTTRGTEIQQTLTYDH
jgi:AcrR family transcriptional regulator